MTKCGYSQECTASLTFEKQFIKFVMLSEKRKEKIAMVINRFRKSIWEN